MSVPGAVPAPPGAGTVSDDGVAWHFGDPFGEQRAAARGIAVVDRSHRPVIRIPGPERLSWLHSLTSQHLESLSPDDGAEDLVLDISGRIQEHFVLTDRDDTLWLDTEPGHGRSLLHYLTSMVFWAKVEPQAADDHAVLTILGDGLHATAPQQHPEFASVVPVPERLYASAPLPGGGFVRRMPWPAQGALDLVVPRSRLAEWWDRLTGAGARPAGTWAFEALRVESLNPRLSVDTDDRTIPHEVRWIGGPDEGGAVHLDKGCYRGQETVARVHNLGRAPRNLVLLHLDGSEDQRPALGDPVTADGRTVGRVGTVIDHFELGPVALALVKRSVPADTPLVAGGVAASIDPDSVPRDDRVQAGRAAIDRLRGR
ncbi:YgfZ/GcvT domain-containing protein [Tomitella fengzijianii]|uniref:Folate-binding protein YgfZ n=1 Tax=Tomitella fengzijianii TaxID=2597660 RepID=A0A516X7L5_9ACTN|nr:folate-binding protein YgfZ [Tomitella fengzijianii]QDQ99056.1 folate-binding protein YgfZ [Tomitella fengzijianii]